MISSVPVHEIISMFWWKDQLHFANSINWVYPQQAQSPKNGFGRTSLLKA